MDIMSLDYLTQEIGGSILPIRGIGGISVEPVGFVMMNVKVPCVQGYDEDQIVIVMDDPGMSECLVILGTPTIYQVMEVIKESEISKLSVPWASSRVSWLMRDIQARLGQVVVNDVANKPISPLNVNEVVKVTSKCTVPPFDHKAIHGKVNLVLHGYKMNVMTHGLEKRSPSLPLGIDVQTVYATLADGSNRVTVVLRNNTQDWLEIKKGILITWMVAANEIPKVTNLLLAEEPKEQPSLTKAERQDLLLEKLDLTGLEAWPEEQVEKVCSLLKECHDIFQKLNSLTVKDSNPLPCICETLESLAGAAHYSTFDMNSGFWQVSMDEESKQYTAFTLGSMGLYECESMTFGLCNTPPTFQRLMLNCLGELNLTYCLIYLDDVIIFSWTEEEHLERMRVVFDHLHEHGLKLKPSKCDMFKTEINYLVHHVSKKGVLPSKKNLEAIAECPPPDTYTKVKSFVGLVGHYRCS